MGEDEDESVMSVMKSALTLCPGRGDLNGQAHY